MKKDNFGTHSTTLLYEAILDTISEGLFLVDVNCRIKVWNSAMEELTGYEAKEAIGMPCSFLNCGEYKSDERSEDSFELELLKKQKSAIQQVEYTIETKGGEKIPVFKKARLLRDKKGHVRGILETLSDIRLIKKLQNEVSAFRKLTTSGHSMGRLVGKSHAMHRLFEQIRLAGNSDVTVMIEGETGAGKELVAEAIHNQSKRKNKAFVKLNCSALSESLLESELFGHIKGSFTGAIKDKIGRFELADGGTIFLDEIGDLSPLIQLKLLRVLQEKEIERVGESVTKKIDVRIVAATHRNLRKLLKEGRFRKDLYYRLRVFSLGIPPLRKRKEDIFLLVESFINRFNTITGKTIQGVTSDVAHCFFDYCWPGNVRELENVIEHGFVTCQGNKLGLFDLPIEIRESKLRRAECQRDKLADNSLPQQESCSADTPPQLLALLKDYKWNKSEVARKLGVSRSTVWRKMKRWNINLSPSSEHSV